MRIDKIKEEYIPPLLSLEAAIFGDCAWNEENFLSEVGSEHSLFFVALEGDEVCACVVANTSPDTAFISKVMVAPEKRRQGVAKALLNALFEAALEKGMEEATLEVRASNSAAIALYSALGFENLGKRRNFYRSPREDAVIMTKKLC